MVFGVFVGSGFIFVALRSSQLHALRIAKAHSGKLFDFAADPAEAAFFVGVRIVDPGDLLRAGKKVFVDEQVMLRQKYAEAGMRVVPADDLGVRILAVFDLVNVLPGVLGKGDVGPTLGGVHAGNTGFHQSAFVAGLADQHAANLGFHGSPGVLADFARNFGFHDHRGLDLDFDFWSLTHAGGAPLRDADSKGPSTAGASPAIR